MGNGITSTPQFERLMKTAEILDGHYSDVTKKAQTARITAALKGDRTTADRYTAILANMRDHHATALDLIADKLTTPNQLRATRRALREAADEANGFVKQLQKVRISIDMLEKAAGFLSGLVTRLTTILA